MLAERSKSIQEMASILTEKKNPTHKEVASMQGIATQVVDGIEYALKIARGEVPRSQNSDWLDKLQKEIDAEDFDNEGD